MTKNNILLLCVLLTISSKLWAQDIYYGKAQQFSATSGDFDVIGRTSGRIYTCRVTNGAYFLDAYDDSMDLKATIALDFLSKKLSGLQFQNYNDHILVFYQLQERGVAYIMGAMLNGRGMIQGKPLLLDSARTAWLDKKSEQFVVKISEDGSRIAVLGLGGIARSVGFKMALYDDRLQLLEQQKVDLNKEQGTPTINLDKAVLTNDGLALIPNYSQIGRRKYLSDIKVLTVDLVRNEILSQDWSTGSHYFSDFELKLDNDTRQCYFGGFYAMKKGDDVTGICFGQFAIKSIVAPSIYYKAFSVEMERAVANNARHPFNNFTVNDLILRGNNGMVMLTEYASSEIRTSYNGSYVGYYSTYYATPINSTIQEYEYGNVAAFSFAPDQGVEWMTVIPKSQYSQEDKGRFSSYGLINSGGQLVLLYNDYDRSRSNLQIAILNGAGELTVTRLNQLNNRSDWVLRRAMQTDLKELVIPALRQGDISYIKLNF